MFPKSGATMETDLLNTFFRVPSVGIILLNKQINTHQQDVFYRVS
jgi:hypothetical protein